MERWQTSVKSRPNLDYAVRNKSVRAYFCGYCLLYNGRKSHYVMGMIEQVMAINNKILNLTHF